MAEQGGTGEVPPSSNEERVVKTPEPKVKSHAFYVLLHFLLN